MALQDPQALTPQGGTAISLPRVLTGTEAGKFVSADGFTTIIVEPTRNGKSRRVSARLDQSKVTTDPLVSTTNVLRGINISIAVRRDNDGYSDADAKKLLIGYLTWLQSAGVIDAWLAGQN